MSSIGPQLPPHLQKRKRTPESHASRDSPPTKVTRRTNEDEIALDDDDSSSDDGYGPSIGPTAGPTMPASGPSSSPSKITAEGSAKPRPAIGPSAPPATFNQDEISLSDEDDASTKTPATTDRPPAPTPARRVIGPAPPPNNLSERPTTDPDSQHSDSDSDSDYGPALPTANSHQHRAALAHTALQTSAAASASAAPKRDDWMLAPAASTERAAPDPTKLKSRKFASGRAAAASEMHAGGISSIWTETPEEKRQRLADAVLGRGGEGAEGSKKKPDGRGKDDAKRRGGGDEEKIRSYTEQTRGKSLYEEHQMRRKAVKEGGTVAAGGAGMEEEDDPSKRAFNWEKDMKAGSTINHAQRRQLLTKSANFGGRFEKGSYL